MRAAPSTTSDIWIARESVERVGALVRAPFDAAHTGRAVVVGLVAVAPVALVRFHCGCAAYVPLRRLIPDDGPPVPACEAAGCRHPRWEGPYCASHARSRPAAPAASRSVVRAEDEKRATTPPARPQRESSPSTTRAPRPASPRAPARTAAAPGVGAPPAGIRATAVGDPSSPSPLAAGRPARSAAGAPSPAPAASRRTGARRVWTEERIIRALLEWTAEHDRVPSMRDWARADEEGRRPTTPVVVQRFGSWNAALRAALLPWRDQARERLTRGQVIEKIKAWVELYGQPPALSDWWPPLARFHARLDKVERFEAGSWPSAKRVTRIFGSWSAAIVAAGFPPNPPGRGRRFESTRAVVKDEGR